MDKILRQVSEIILGRTLFSSEYSYNIHNTNISREEGREYIEEELFISLSKQLYKSYKSKVTVDTISNMSIETLKIELMAFPLEDFKYIVESYIKLIPEEKLREIRGE